MTIAKEILSRGLSNDDLEDVCFEECLGVVGGSEIVYIFKDESEIIFDGLTYSEVTE